MGLSAVDISFSTVAKLSFYLFEYHSDLEIQELNMFEVYILLQLVFGSVLGTVTFHDCGSAYELSAVNIQGCDDDIPCFVTIGEDILVSLDFYANLVPQNLDQNVVIHINHLNLRTQVSPERCGIYDCPVMITDAMSSLTSVMSVPTSIALNQRGYLYWRIENEEGKQVLCYRVTVQTQSRVQRLMREYMKTASISRDDDQH